MSVKKDILWRVGVVYSVLVVLAALIIGKIVWLQSAGHDTWSVKSETAPVKEFSIEANRGNIYSSGGKLLAVSVPYYDLRMDLTVDSLTRDYFADNLQPLSKKLASLFGDRTWWEYKQDLLNARADSLQYYLIKRNITYDQMLKTREFPIFNRGRYKGGVLYEKKSTRVRPNGILAARTVGYTSKSVHGSKVGLEGAYDDRLSGREGLKLFKYIKESIYVPLSDENEIDPIDGMDVVSTIDLKIQDVAEKELYRQLKKNKAKHGTAVLMEVKTGDIRAIANLTRGKDGKYRETMNYAVGESTVPGSTFKTASIMVAMEDYVIDLNDSVDIRNGSCRFFRQKVKDSQKKYRGKTSVQNIFEASSNVGVTLLIHDKYKDHPEDFIKGLYKLGLNRKLGIEIKGEGTPFIKNTDHTLWSKVSLPMMAMGYELTLTPLQILAFYNGIANEGKVMKPRFVKEIQYRGETVKQIKPEVLNSGICSRETLEKLKTMLVGVVEEGTAKNLKNSSFKIAGKTGTAQIPDSLTGYRDKSRITYQASFVGFFPSHDPIYSCIVVVNGPSDAIYGNVVAGPVFQKIAEKVYATRLDMHNPVNAPEREKLAEAPYTKSGSSLELSYALKSLDIDVSMNHYEGEWVSTWSHEDSVTLYQREIKDNIVPNVIDMALKDAVFILESKGLKPVFKGRGTVRSQSIPSGTVLKKGQRIELTMSLGDR